MLGHDTRTVYLLPRSYLNTNPHSQPMRSRKQIFEGSNQAGNQSVSMDVHESNFAIAQVKDRIISTVKELQDSKANPTASSCPPPDVNADTDTDADADADTDADDVNLDLKLAQSFTLTIDEGGGQLSAPKTHSKAEPSIPQEIIASGVSSSSIQSELSRPIFAGTYGGSPAYLLTLQFRLSDPGSSRNWLTRIQKVNISVLLEDAPRAGNAEQLDQDSQSDWSDGDESEPQHPSIVKSFPGPDGFLGPVSTKSVSTEREAGVELGWEMLGVNARWGQNSTRDVLSVMEVTAVRKGQQRNSLLVVVAENAADAAGVPGYLAIPLILTHHNRRFSMRVTVHAKFGFWRGKLAEMVPVLGRTAKPLFFDPAKMKRAMENGKRGIGGVKGIEWRGDLEDIDLRESSSLKGPTVGL
ncbi:uncharacterized protein PAC_12601 [Phialocephala subalpina]|uniref:Uncharacterized protein n=1 Tax=Phialocephala subalpina TaxID=576137 RepID=A0A1L7XCE1_9HELO|nr:uncharacterized protein PAC_12601 [Phialocephala subalpina]